MKSIACLLAEVFFFTQIVSASNIVDHSTADHLRPSTIARDSARWRQFIDSLRPRSGSASDGSRRALLKDLTETAKDGGVRATALQGVRTLEDLEREGYDFRGKRVFVRVDFNVLNDQGAIANRARIREALPTIQFLTSRGAKVVLLSHQEVDVGEGEKKVKKNFSLAPVAFELSGLLGQSVYFDTSSITQDGVHLAGLDTLGEGGVFLVENTRKNPGETSEKAAVRDAFAKKLFAKADLFVFDGFGVSHRKHATTVHVPSHIPQVVGFLVENEITQLSRAIENPERPLVLMIGGAKLNEKVGLLESFVGRMKEGDTILVGGLAARPFLEAKKLPLPRDDEPETVLNAIDSKRAMDPNIRAAYLAYHTAQKRGVEVLVADMMDADENPRSDILPDDLSTFSKRVHNAKTIVWAGPLGKIEDPAYAQGTKSMAREVAEATMRGAISIIGGGDTGSVLEKLPLADQVTWNSTGGGATLTFLSKGDLPVLAHLRELGKRAADGGTKGGVVDATVQDVTGRVIAAVGEEGLREKLDVLSAVGIREALDARAPHDIFGLTRAVAREFLVYQDETRGPIPFADDFYSERTLAIPTVTPQPSVPVVLSISRLLDRRLSPRNLVNLLYKTGGAEGTSPWLFFTSPNKATRGEFERAGRGHYLALIKPARLADRVLGGGPTKDVVFLLDAKDQEEFGIKSDQLLASTVVERRRAFVVPLNAPVDIAREIYLGDLLATHSSSLEGNLDGLDATTQFLLAEIAQGVDQAERFAANIHDDLERAKSVVTEILVGM